MTEAGLPCRGIPFSYPGDLMEASIEDSIYRMAEDKHQKRAVQMEDLRLVSRNWPPIPAMSATISAKLVVTCWW